MAVAVQREQRPFPARGGAFWLHVRGDIPKSHDCKRGESGYRLVFHYGCGVARNPRTLSRLSRSGQLSSGWQSVDLFALESDNVTYTAVDAVFHVFRRRLTAQHGLDFASVLPCVPRAIFVNDWQVEDPPAPFEDSDAMTSEEKPDLSAAPDLRLYVGPHDLPLDGRRIAYGVHAFPSRLLL